MLLKSLIKPKERLVTVQENVTLEEALKIEFRLSACNFR